VRLHIRCISGSGAADSIEGIVEDVTEVRALERQLQQAQKFETIGQLAGGIAHDFNNVLGAVLGWAEIGYDQSREHPQIAEYFAHIRQQTERCGRADAGIAHVCPPPASAAAPGAIEPDC